MTTAQCKPCPWRDMTAMRKDFPEVVAHAGQNPAGFVCHTRCVPCPGPALERANRLLDRLDVEEDDRVRCDLITDLQDLADAHGGAVRQAVKEGGVPVN